MRNAARPPRLTILGAGTCMLTPERACSGYWVEAGPVRMRLDSGPGTMHAMTRFGLPWETVTHQFISHGWPRGTAETSPSPATV